MKTFLLNHIPAVLYGEPSENVFIYVHGKSGNKEVAASFYQMVTSAGWQVLSIDLPEHGERKGSEEKFNPWTIVPELSLLYSYAAEHWTKVGLCAESIGAYFALRAFWRKPFEQVLFISPITDMAGFIDRLMEKEGITAEELKANPLIETKTGIILTWDYYYYSHENPIKLWDSPTAILTGAEDHIVELSSVEAFAEQFGCSLTVAEGCEHWFHTEEQLAVVEQWAQSILE